MIAPAPAKGGSAVGGKIKSKKVPAKSGSVSASPTGDIQKIRIRLSAYESKILDASVKQLVDTALRHDATIEGPVPIPTAIKKYTVNRGAFVHKNAREQFEMRIHKRLIDILNPSAKLIESLTSLTLPSGVNIDVKMM